MLRWVIRSTSSGAQNKAMKNAAMVAKIAESGQSVDQYFRMRLKRNSKIPKVMDQLQLALERLNALRIQDLDQRRMEFVLI